ncbi:TetR/AcrR family transcriptional regulator [Dermacoccaceae bacterium W4C1]
MTRTSRPRMTGAQRREQLLQVGRAVFAERGVANATVEEIASAAGVTKPVVYEHFGGKEGLYAVVVDREMQALLDLIGGALAPDLNGRPLVTRAIVAAMDYVEQRPDGFRVLTRDSPTWHGTDRLGSLLADIGEQVEAMLARDFSQTILNPQYAQLYAQMLMGIIAYTGEWWLEHQPEITREELTAHLENFAWNGLGHLQPEPKLPTTNGLGGTTQG